MVSTPFEIVRKQLPKLAAAERAELRAMLAEGEEHTDGVHRPRIQRFDRRGREICLDENGGVLRDGERLRVPMMLAT